MENFPFIVIYFLITRNFSIFIDITYNALYPKNRGFRYLFGLVA